MTFFSITNHHNPDTNALLRKACEDRQITYTEIDQATFRYDQFPDTAGHLVYRVNQGVHARRLETIILTPSTTTCYKHEQRKWLSLKNPAHTLQEHGVPIPKTALVPEDKEALAAAAEYVGGFPAILKVMGGSHGVGVMRTESLASLLSVVDYLGPKTDLVLRQYIEFAHHARVIVLGGKAVETIEYVRPPKDFRTNRGTPTVQKATFAPEVLDVAVRAVDAYGLDFGGVDVLVDKDGKPYVIEVNFPCFFPRVQAATGTDIAGMLVQFLIDKSKKQSA